MFCYHCQEAKKNIACDTAGICGKKADVSSLHDLLTYALKGLSFYSVKAAELGIHEPNINRFAARAWYSMVTNVNFNGADFTQLISEAVQRRKRLKRIIIEAGGELGEGVPDEAEWDYGEIDQTEFVKKGETVGVMDEDELTGEAIDLHAAKEMLIYAIKGLGALLEHIQVLGTYHVEYYVFMHQVVAYSLDKKISLESLLAMSYQCGEHSLELMALLGHVNRQTFGEPELTAVHIDTWERPGILVTGHDYQDLHDLLEQSMGAGVDIYTHGEMITAHSYPAFKKYFHLVANYGGAWQDQKTQFGKFNGPVLVTSNSFQQPKKSYIDKAYTSGMVGWPDITHINKRRAKEPKNFSRIIEQAKRCEAPTPLAEGAITVGYGREVLFGLVGQISESIQSGAIQRIVVLAGYDGRHKERKYYTNFMSALPQDTLILTAGDTKYRFNTLDLGEIDNIPRLLDVGQAHDFYVVLEFLDQLKSVLALAGISEVPVSYSIAWYEQQTILMMLALFARGDKNITIGPTLPPFFSPGILQRLVDDFSITGIDSVEQDIARLFGEPVVSDVDVNDAASAEVS